MSDGQKLGIYTSLPITPVVEIEPFSETIGRTNRQCWMGMETQLIAQFRGKFKHDRLVLTVFLICCRSLLTVAILSSLSPYLSISKFTVAWAAADVSATLSDAAAHAINSRRPTSAMLPVEPPSAVMENLRVFCCDVDAQ